MNNKILYAVVAVLAIALLGIYIYGKSQNQGPAVQTSGGNQNAATNMNAPGNSNTEPANANQANTNTNQAANANTNAQGHYSDESDIEASADVVEVTYDGSKFSPSTVSIKAGDIVVFKNASDSPMRVASDPHPIHTGYPGFDSKTGIAPGKTYEFKFTQVGSWGYHDHLNPSATGTVKVSK